jgi:hypothetical protein
MASLFDRSSRPDEEEEERRKAILEQPRQRLGNRSTRIPGNLGGPVPDVPRPISQRASGRIIRSDFQPTVSEEGVPEEGLGRVEENVAQVEFAPEARLRARQGRGAGTVSPSAVPGAFGPFTGIRGAERARAAAARDIAQEEAEKARERRIEEQLQRDANVQLSGDMTLTELADAATRRNLAVARLRDRRQLQSDERIAAGEQQRQLREAQITAGTERAQLAAEAEKAAQEQANKDREFRLEVEQFGLDRAIADREASEAQTKAERERIKEEAERKTELLRNAGLPDDRIAELKMFVNTKDQNFSNISDNDLQNAAVLMNIRDVLQRQVPGLVLNTTEDVLKVIDSVDEEVLASIANTLARAPFVGGIFDASVGRFMRAIDDTDINIVDPDTGREIADIDFADAFRTPRMKQLIMQILVKKGRTVTGLRRNQP